MVTLVTAQRLMILHGTTYLDKSGRLRILILRPAVFRVEFLEGKNSREETWHTARKDFSHHECPTFSEDFCRNVVANANVKSEELLKQNSVMSRVQSTTNIMSLPPVYRKR
jgi:hypothetical protein